MALTQKEISHNFYKRRRDNGLCVRCGKPLDRKGIYCTECNKKHMNYENKTIEFCKTNNICYLCRKEKVPKGETICPECKAKQLNRTKPLTEERRLRVRELERKRYSKVYSERKRNGICTKCGKRKAVGGKTKCGVCLEKDAYNHKVASERKLKEA